MNLGNLVKKLFISTVLVPVIFFSSCASYNTVMPLADPAKIEKKFEEFQEKQKEKKKTESKKGKIQTNKTEEKEKPKQPYFEELEKTLKVYDKQFRGLKAKPDEDIKDIRIVWISNNIEKITEKCESLILLIKYYTRLDINTNNYKAGVLFNDIVFGAKRYYQTIGSKRSWRFDSINFRLVLEIIGRDLDSVNNSNDYTSSQRYRNRSDSIVDLFIAGIGQKIMHKHHYDVGHSILADQISIIRYYLNEKLKESPAEYLDKNMDETIKITRGKKEEEYDGMNRPLLFALMIGENTEDILKTWLYNRNLPEKEFYEHMKEVAKTYDSEKKDLIKKIESLLRKKPNQTQPSKNYPKPREYRPSTPKEKIP